MMFRCALPALLLFVVAAPAFGQVELKHKYQEGSNFTTEVISNVKQTLSLAGMDVETKAETIVTTKSSVGKKNENGLVPVKAKVETMQVTMDVQGNEYTFDSANPDDKGTSPLEMLRDVHKAIIGAETTLLIDKEGRVSEVQRPDIGLDSANEVVKQLASSQLKPEYLKQQANQAIEQLPSQAVKMGDTWQRTESVDLGGSQIMTFKKRYTYEGTTDDSGKKLHKITSKVLEVELAIGADSPSPAKLKESKLKADESTGELLFDPMLGQFVKNKTSIKIVGEMTLEIGGQEIPAKIDLTMSAEATVR